MPSLTLSDRLIWFAHCPKSGGTSVEWMMVDTWGGRVGHLHWGWDQWWRTGGWRHADPPNSPQHLTWNDAAALLSNPPDAVFALVRDPVTRLASEHRYQRHLRRGTWAGRALARLPFSLWLRLMLAVAARNPFAFDNHLRPQVDFIPLQAKVFLLEDGMTNVIEWLEQVTGQPLACPSQLLATPRRGARRDPSAPSDRALIARTHAEDYTRFNYPPDTSVPPERPMLDALAACAAPLVAWLDRHGRL